MSRAVFSRSFGVLYEACAVAIALHEAMKLYSYPMIKPPVLVTFRFKYLKTASAPATEKLCIISYLIASKNAIFLSRLQQSLPSQLDLPRSFSRLETAFTHARHATIAKLDLILNFGERARAVVREVNAAERVRAEVFVAMGYIESLDIVIRVT